ncbi:T9SS type A sorting domain-containing protein [Seonamhaeicola sp.]|uniref:T9SS type A sorting domain-containing protein n=1 Tax=Seonamhaeicola sp. TaxID=1912245 RepID=UPI00262CF14E|nr:T9SS type A sorting domain-containing protein [Seonamhaeicola sp.]
MKKLPALLLLSLIPTIGFSQSIYVQTPNNTNVYVYDKGAEYSATEIQDLEDEWNDEIDDKNWHAEIIGPASRLYNCHYYAFHVSEPGGTTAKYWMDHDEAPDDSMGAVRKYLDAVYGGDNSYKKLAYSKKHLADKVFYNLHQDIYNMGSGHSADFSPDPQGRGWDWVSKWTDKPLFRHALIGHVYAGFGTSDTAFSYFAKCAGQIDWGNPQITGGVDTMCSNDPEVTYSFSGNIKNTELISIEVRHHDQGTNAASEFHSVTTTIDNGQSGTISIDPKNGQNGEYDIVFVLDNGCVTKEVKKESVKVIDAPSVSTATIVGPWEICLNQPFSVWIDGVVCTNMTVNWNPNNGQVLSQNGCSAQIEQFYNDAYIFATITNECGESKNMTLYIPVGSGCGWGYYMVYSDAPNDIIKIALNAETDIKTIKKQGLHDMQFSLRNMNGQDVLKSSAKRTLSRSSRDALIDTSGLEAGVYILRMVYGQGKGVEYKKVIVE